jgi:tRNA threonylcarbamoyladenosine biosynthesis protein TsaE
MRPFVYAKMVPMTFTSNNLEDTLHIAKTFLMSCKPLETAAKVVGLSGDLGSGKTTFTQAVAQELGVIETVTSPTFVIEKIYKLDGKEFDHLIHIDAYRLDQPQELLHLGWQELMDNPKNLIFIEWPEKVEEILPPTIQKISFKNVNESTREIDIAE